MRHISRFLTPTLITVISYFLSANHSTWHSLFRYDRDAILHGEAWRILTGNITHAGLGHWTVNMFGLWLLWYIYTENGKKYLQLLFVLLLTSAGTCVSLLLMEPQLKWYVGLSGALHGLFAAGIVLSFNNEPRIQLLFAILLFCKLLYEQLFGPLPGSEKMTETTIVVNSHLYGAITGIITGILLKFRELRCI
jgi:rhomboid family GlyGly-CTERM serine protease